MFIIYSYSVLIRCDRISWQPVNFCILLLESGSFLSNIKLNNANVSAADGVKTKSGWGQSISHRPCGKDLPASRRWQRKSRTRTVSFTKLSFIHIQIHVSLTTFLILYITGWYFELILSLLFLVSDKLNCQSAASFGSRIQVEAHVACCAYSVSLFLYVCKYISGRSFITNWVMCWINFSRFSSHIRSTKLPTYCRFCQQILSRSPRCSLRLFCFFGFCIVLLF